MELFRYLSRQNSGHLKIFFAGINHFPSQKRFSGEWMRSFPARRNHPPVTSCLVHRVELCHALSSKYAQQPSLLGFYSDLLDISFVCDLIPYVFLADIGLTMYPREVSNLWRSPCLSLRCVGVIGVSYCVHL